MANMKVRASEFLVPVVILLPLKFYVIARFLWNSVNASLNHVPSGELRAYIALSSVNNLPLTDFTPPTFIHSFIHCRHLYSASSSGATQKRSQPQRGRIMLF